MKIKSLLVCIGFISLSLLVGRCTDKNIDVEIPPTPDLTSWLDENPNIKAALRIENSNLPAPSFIGGGALSELSYNNWSEADKQSLQAAFERAWIWKYSSTIPFSNLGADEFTMPLNCDSCEALLISDPSDSAITLIPETLSKTVYLATVAHALVLEISGALSWSLLSSNAATLHHFFNSRAIMHRNNSTTDFMFGAPDGTVNQRIKYIGNAVPATPRFTYAWLINQNILKATHQETIVALLQWSRENMVHYYGSSTYANTFDHWQYAGRPPVDLILQGTEYAGDPGIKHWTAGCHGTAGFIKSVLRAVNIPVEPLYVCGHAQLYFPSIQMYLDHGDNPYNNNVINSSLPIENILIDRATHTTWFSASPDFLNPANPLCANIGRKTDDFVAAPVGNLIISDGPSYDYGQVVVGNTSDRTLTVTNVGGGTATALSGTGLAAPFSFLGGAYPGTGGTCGPVLAAAASCNMVVRYSPLLVGVDSDTVVLDYNDGSNAQSATRALIGTGIP